MNTGAVTEAMLEIFSKHGKTKSLLTDMGSVFMIEVTREVVRIVRHSEIHTSLTILSH